MIRLKQEGQIKTILTTVGDYVKVEEDKSEEDEKEKVNKEPSLSSEPTSEPT